MFTIDPSISDRMIRGKDLFKVLFSMNQHQVATPDLSVEDARSYVFFSREDGRICVYVGLFFLRTGAHQYYTHSSNPFPEGQMPEIEAAARSFTEDLGALLDDLDFGSLSSDEKKRWFDDQEAITRGEQEAVPREPAGPAERLQPEEPVQPDPVFPEPKLSPPVQPSASPPIPPVTPALEPAVPLPAAPPGPPAPAAAIPPGPAPSAARAEQTPASGTQVPPAPAGAPPAEAQTAPAAGVQGSRPFAPPRMPAAASPASSLATTSAAPHRVRPRKNPEPRPVAPVSDPPSTQTARPEDVLEEAVKAGVVKAPKAQLKKDIRTAAGVVSRDKEALARLLASF